MIPIRTYRAYWQLMKNRIANLGQMFFVRTEDELARTVKELAEGELALIVVVPSADTMAPDHDNVRELEMAMIYSLQKINRNNMDENDLVNTQETTQNVIKTIKQWILWDAASEESPYHLLCRDMNLNKMHTDPEYNLLNCDGYSLSIQFNTTGF